MAFWGAIVRPGKAHAYVPPPEPWNLHLSQASLPPTVPEGTRVALAIHVDEEDDDSDTELEQQQQASKKGQKGKRQQQQKAGGPEPLILCTLTAGRTDTAMLDLFLSQYAELSVIGNHPVHVTGYFSPAHPEEDDDEDEEGEEEDDEEYAPPLGHPALAGLRAGARGGGGSDDDDDDDELDSEDEDDLAGLDEDEDEDEDVDMDGEMFGFAAAVGRRKPHVVIEEVREEADQPDKKQGGKAHKGGKAEPVANGKAAGAQGKGQAAKAPAVSESEEGDEDEDMLGEEDEGEDEEEEDEEEDEETPVPKGSKGGKQLGGADGKRPASAAAPKGAEQPAAKKQAAGQQQQPQPVAKQPEGKQAKAKEEPKQQQQQQQQGKQQQQQQTPGKAQADAAAKSAEKKKAVRTFANGFQVEDVKYGNPHGKLAKPGHKVLVRYTGRLKSNGKVFDKSGAKPFTFRLGVGEVIKGWDLGVEGMKVGDSRRLVIPPQLAYGSAGVRGTIPANATLEFDVELVDVK